MQLQLQISPSNEYSGLISCRIDWFDLLAVQRSLLKSSPIPHTVQKHSLLWHSTFCMVQLSHSYMTTGKTMALTRETFVGTVMSLFFKTREIGRVVYNMLKLSGQNTRRLA